MGRVFAFQSVAMTLGLLCWPVSSTFTLKILHIQPQALSMIYLATAQVCPEAVYLVKSTSPIIKTAFHISLPGFSRSALLGDAFDALHPSPSQCR